LAGIVALVVAVALALLTAGSAGALTYVPHGSFSGASADLVVGGVAADSVSGAAYVTVQRSCLAAGFCPAFVPFGAGTVKKFAAKGAAGSPASMGSGEFTGVAVNQSTQHVYALSRAAGTGQVQGFTPAGVAVGPPLPVNVDSSTAAVVQIATDAAGMIYYPNQVDDTIEKIDPSTGATNVLITGLVDPTDVDVDAIGNVYVVDNGQARVRKYTSAGALDSTVATGGSAYSVAVHRGPAGDILVGSNDGGGYHVSVYPAGGGAATSSFGLGSIASNAGNRVGVNYSTGRVYVTETGTGMVRMFVPPPSLPIATTDPATAVDYRSATLEGRVDPEGFELTSCVFEYGKTPAYGQTAPCVPNAAAIGEGTADVAVEAAVSGLDSSSTYHFRVVAGNITGQDQGDDQTFATAASILPPTVTTGAASNIAPTSATVAGTVNPQGSQIEDCAFEYGETVAYGESVPCVPTPGAGTNNVSVTANLTGLDRSTTYHYRLTATNGNGTTDATDANFRTFAKSIGGFIGGPNGPAAGQFSSPRGLGVNLSGAGAGDTGDVYVAEQPNLRVQVLDAAGNFKFMFGRNVIAPGAPGDLGDVFEVCSVAADCQQATTGIFYNDDQNEPQVDNPGGEFRNPQGLAVDQSTGDVFVRDRGHRNVQQFTAAGEFVRSWGWNVIQPGRPGDLGDVFEACEVAADCQAGSGGGSVAGTRAGEFGASNTSGTGIAVSPANGHVFVADWQNRRVMEFDPDAATQADVFVRALGAGVDTGSGSTFEACTTASTCAAGTSGTANGQLSNNQPLHIAVDADNVVYMSDNSSGGTANRVLRFDADLTPASGNASAALLAPINHTTATVPGPLLNGVTQGLAIDPTSGNLLITRDPSSGDTVVEEIENPADTPPALARDSLHVYAAQAGLGLAVNPSHDLIYLAIAATTGAGHGLMVLANSDGAPTGVQVDQPAAVGATDVTLAGSADSNGGVVSYLFEVSDTGATDDWEPVGTRQFVAGTGTVGMNATATGLEPNTNYRVRLSVTKQTAFNTSTQLSSGEATFTTDATTPTVQTLGSTNRTDTTATLRATIDPNGLATTYWFQYGGRGQTLDHTIPIPAANAGSGNTSQQVVQNVTGLIPDTAYDYRIVAQNAAGTTTGTTVAFDTTTPPGPQTPIADRGYELVSPADKISGIGVGGWGASPTLLIDAGIAAYDGERFAAQGTQGALLLGDAAQGYANDWAFADRTSDSVGWQSHTPLTHPEHGAAEARFMQLQAATGDLSRLAWRTNNFTARIFEELAAWPVNLNPSFFSDWDGRWEIVGPAGPADQVAAQLSGARSHPTDFELCEMAFSRDGSAGVCGTDLSNAAGGIAILRGLAGPGDPTHPVWPDLVGGRSVYSADVSGPLADNYDETGSRELVNVCAGETVLPAVNGSGDLDGQTCGDPLPGRDSRLVSERGATLQFGDAGLNNRLDGSLENVVSGDGSRVFFMAPDPEAAGVPDAVQSFCVTAGDVCPTQLFVRQRNPDGSLTTRWISRPEAGLFGSQDASLLGTVRFEGASVDGDKVFFRTNSPLTADDRNASGAAPVTTGQASNRSWDLYMYDLPDGPGADPADGELTRISGGPGGASDCNSPVGGSGAVGALRFVSDDGSRVYFTCAAPLQGITGPPGSGTTTLPGGTPDSTDQSNLYLYDTAKPAGERWRFVARLPRATGAGINSCATTGLDPKSPIWPSAFVGIGSNCMSGTNDGEFVTFLTLGSLTADDPTAQSAADYYAYDADTDQLIRISAPAGGVGGAYQCVADSSTLCNADTGYDMVDLKLRSPLPSLAVASSPLSPGSRVVFFQSRSRLTVDDTDSAMDVFEWRDGELSLVTGGVEPGVDAFYKGNDRTGRNVYFATADAVTWQDHDAVADVYTARVGGGIAQPAPPSLCDALGDGCQGDFSGVSTSVQPRTAPSAGGVDNVSSGPRKALTVAGLSAKARRKAARSGVIRVRVGSSRAGAVRLLARGRIGKRTRRVGRASTRLSKPGAVTVAIRLSGAARKQLRRGRKLSVSIRVSSPDARPKSIRVALRRTGR
jgi:hypothetical protein